MTSSGMEGERKRVIKSLKYHKAAVDRFLPAFLRALAPVDPTQSRALLKRLSTMVQEGEAPSFADPGARSGYIRRRMEHRSAQMSIFLQHPHLHAVLHSLMHSPLEPATAAGGGGGLGCAKDSVVFEAAGAGPEKGAHGAAGAQGGGGYEGPFRVASIGGTYS